MDLTKKARTYQFENRTFSSEDIQLIADQPGLVGLVFKNCPITDKDIETLSSLPKLVNLTLENTHISDNALEYLANIATLQYLFIVGADIDGSGLIHLQSHKKLNTLWLDNTCLNNDGVKYLIDFQKLGVVRFVNTEVTYDGLMSLASNYKIKVAGDHFSEQEMRAFEAEQRTLNKKTLTFDAQDIETAKAQLLDFFDAITAWEQLAEKDHDEDDLLRQCIGIFATYCTEKKRKGFRPHWISFSYGPNYSYANHHIVDWEQPNKNKLYIYTRDDYLDTQYRFLFSQKTDKWMLDEGYVLDGGWKKYGL